MKKIHFTQVANTHNVYTSDALKDASGTYLNIHDVLDYLEGRLATLKAAAATAHTDESAAVILTRANEINLFLQELK